MEKVQILRQDRKNKNLKDLDPHKAHRPDEILLYLGNAERHSTDNLGCCSKKSMEEGSLQE